MQLLFNGLTLGAGYGLLALGFALALRSAGAINFAHGEVFMVGAMTGFIASDKFAANGLWESNWLRLSESDRSDWPGALQAAGWKYLEGSHWVVTPDECNLISEQVGGVTPKRHKASVGQQTWVDEWVAWHKKAAKVGGYIVYAEG